jgi:hypothetical protein
MNDNQLDKCRKRLEQFLIDLLDPVGRSERRYWGSVYVRGLLLDGESQSNPWRPDAEGNVQPCSGSCPTLEWEPIWGASRSE